MPQVPPLDLGAGEYVATQWKLARCVPATHFADKCSAGAALERSHSDFATHPMESYCTTGSSTKLTGKLQMSNVQLDEPGVFSLFLLMVP